MIQVLLKRIGVASWAASCTWLVLLGTVFGQTPTVPPDPSGDVAAPAVAAAPRVSAAEGLRPFGANLFEGNFSRNREDGLNPDYLVMPGDRVAVYTWGAVEIKDLFVVDGQGNIFLPQIGPVALGGVRHADLTSTVTKAIRRVYVRHVNVYTNLMNASPVGVFVTGGVVQPGRYAGVPSDSPLFFLDQAGGIHPELGSYRNIEVLREGEVVHQVDLYAFLLKGTLPTVQFQDGDTILVKRRGPVVEVRGDVAVSSLVELPEGNTTGDLALEVVPQDARATGVTVSGLRNGVQVSRSMSVQEFASAPLRPGDVITVRADGRQKTILVHLEGEFNGPSVLAVRRGARLIDVLNHVPVDPEMADWPSVYIRRASVARAQRDAIHDSLYRLERSALLALSSSTGEANIRAKEAELIQAFAQRARNIDPLGRVVTSYLGQQRNLALEDGDTIVIPPRTFVVRVGGEVQMAQAVMYERGMTAKEYVARAGGYSDRGDTDRVILLHPNAEVELAYPETPIRPGDEILVPPKVDTKLLQAGMDITQIIYQIAVAATVVVGLR